MGNVDDLHGEFVLLNNDEINEAFDRGVIGVLEFDGRDVVVAVLALPLLFNWDRFSFVDCWKGGRRCLARRSLLVKKSACISSHNFLKRLACPNKKKNMQLCFFCWGFFYQ